MNLTTATATDTYVLRHARPDDLAAVTALWDACHLAEYGTSIATVEDTRSQWERTGFELARDAWVAETSPGGPLAAYGDGCTRDPAGTERPRFILDLYVHPAHRGGPVGGQMLAQLEAWAAAWLAALPPGTRARLQSAAAAVDEPGLRLHEQAGYAVAGHSWIMRSAHAALVTEAFSDLNDYHPMTFERWANRMHERETFDPRWWFPAWAPGPDGDPTLAGAALCFLEGDRGWVSQLAVRRAWRRQGLALALLRQAFGAFYQVGVTVVELGVDAANATGATRVYERAGMTIARHYVRFEKTIGG